MYSYENRFEALKKYLYDDYPSPSSIYNIMQSLEISQRIAMEICYNISRSKFRSFLKPELEDPDFEDPFVKLMPAELWRYFKLNCCIYADRYKESSPYTKYSATKKYKPLSHMHLDFIRYLNNWYNCSVFLSPTSLKEQHANEGFFINKSQLSKDFYEERDVRFLLQKADELARIYGYARAEDMFKAKLLDPMSNKLNILPMAS